MSGHKRSKLNAFLDNCPEWVQQAVWGESDECQKGRQNIK